MADANSLESILEAIKPVVDAETLDKIVKALEKQTPTYVESYGLAFSPCYCPTCGSETRKYDKFCYNCGQALIYALP